MKPQKNTVASEKKRSAEQQLQLQKVPKESILGDHVLGFLKSKAPQEPKAIGNYKRRDDVLPQDPSVLSFVLWSLDEGALVQVLCNACAYASDAVFEKVCEHLESLGQEQLADILQQDSHRCFSRLLSHIDTQKEQSPSGSYKDILGRLTTLVLNPTWQSAWRAHLKEADRLQSSTNVPLELVLEGLHAGDARVLPVLEQVVLPWLQAPDQSIQKVQTILGGSQKVQGGQKLLELLCQSVAAQQWKKHPLMAKALAVVGNVLTDEQRQGIAVQILQKSAHLADAVCAHVAVPDDKIIEQVVKGEVSATNWTASEQQAFWDVVLQQQWVSVPALQKMVDQAQRQQDKSVKKPSLLGGAHWENQAKERLSFLASYIQQYLLEQQVEKAPERKKQLGRM